MEQPFNCPRARDLDIRNDDYHDSYAMTFLSFPVLILISIICCYRSDKSSRPVIAHWQDPRTCSVDRETISRERDSAGKSHGSDSDTVTRTGDRLLPVCLLAPNHHDARAAVSLVLAIVYFSNVWISVQVETFSPASPVWAHFSPARGCTLLRLPARGPNCKNSDMAASPGIVSSTPEPPSA